MTKKALGRGLSTLLPARTAPSPHATPVPSPEVGAQQAGKPLELPIDSIEPNPFQPRRYFDPAGLEELASSIASDGIIQPLVVRHAGNTYQLIAGERRWRAARLAGLEVVPVHIQNLPDDRMLEVALIENIQREDLNPMETAWAFFRLHKDLGLPHEEIGRRTGKDRATISNSIRLLALPPTIQELIAQRLLSPGHARTLLKLPDPNLAAELAQETIRNEWSVRHLEALTAHLMNPAHPEPPEPKTKPIDPNVQAAVEELERVLGTRVRLVEKRQGAGRLEVDYYSAEDLDRIYSLITRE